MKKPQIFVIYPYSETTHAIYEIIATAAAMAGATVVRTDTLHERDQADNILKVIREVIDESQLVVADVGHANTSVMYEVGFAEAKNKPLILMAEGSRSIPYDLAGKQVLIYDPRSPNDTVERLTKRIALAISNPESFLHSALTAKSENSRNVFISYCHKDREYLDRLIVHLKPLEKEGLIDVWVDTRLRPGDRWQKEIEKALNKATVAVLLVSADFLASDFITGDELPPLLRDAEQKGTRIIPLILKPCRFSRDKNLRHFQAINGPNHALIRIPEAEQELIYDSLAAEIEKTLQKD